MPAPVREEDKVSAMQIGRQVQNWALALARHQEGTGRWLNTHRHWEAGISADLAGLLAGRPLTDNRQGGSPPCPLPLGGRGEASPGSVAFLFQGLAVGLIGIALPKLTWNLRRAAG